MGKLKKRGGAVRGSPLRPRSYHLVRALVSSIQAEPTRLVEMMAERGLSMAHTPYALGAALRTGVRETLETVCPAVATHGGSTSIRQDPRRVRSTPTVPSIGRAGRSTSG